MTCVASNSEILRERELSGLGWSPRRGYPTFAAKQVQGFTLGLFCFRPSGDKTSKVQGQTILEPPGN
jgi:hypothetical protein